MPLNVVSNYAANVAHRNLQMTDTAASSSLAKLSIGKRVVSARDDAASMAIGSQMNSEVAGLKQAVVNAGQANSMLQIADGAMSTVSDVLTRMKTISIQASSGNLTDTQRGFLDSEFQALLSEIDRIAEDTDFAGVKLLDGSYDVSQGGPYAVSGGVAAVSAQGVGDFTAATTFAFDYATTATGNVFTAAAATGTYSGTVDSSAYSGTGTDSTLTTATTVVLDGAGTSPGSITISLNTAFALGTNHTAAPISFAGNTELSLEFKLGTDTQAEDSLTFSLNAVSATGLGMGGNEAISTQTGAAASMTAIDNAIDNLNEFRADVGAAQNRLDFASANLNVSIENAEAARSTLLDLDIAAEMTTFTSKQVLLQTGVAMLAQAHQLPQNLLRLLQ
jgi:flagellin